MKLKHKPWQPCSPARIFPYLDVKSPVRGLPPNLPGPVECPRRGERLIFFHHTTVCGAKLAFILPNTYGKVVILRILVITCYSFAAID